MCVGMCADDSNINNFHPLEVVGRGSDAQLQVGENLNYVF